MANIGRTGFGLADNLRYNEWYADSTEGTGGTSDHPVFTLEALHNVVGLKVLEAIIPFTYYVFATPTTFTLHQFDGDSDIVLPPAAYTPSSLATELANLLTTASGAEGPFTVTYDPLSMKFTFSVSPPDTWWFIFPPESATQATLMGFGVGTYATGTDGVLVAPNVARLTGPDYLYVCSNALGILTNETIRRGALPQSGPIIAQIPVGVNPGGLVYWNDPDPTKYFEVDSASLSSVDLYIAASAVGGGLTPLAFNGAPFVLKIAFITADPTVNKRSAGVQLSGRVRRLVFTQ